MDDLIQRQAVLDGIDAKAWEFCDYLISKGRNDEQKPVSHFADNLREFVSEELPSVKPQEPTTVLYSGDGYADGYMVYDMAECPNCGYEYEDGDKDWGLPFCPNCGQELNWERSDKE